MTTERQPWERMKDAGETALNYQAFTFYLKLPPGKRSQSRAWYDFRTQMRPASPEDPLKVPSRWRDWCAKFKWVARSRAFDEHTLKTTRKRHAAELVEVYEQQAQAGAEIFERVKALIMERLDSGKIRDSALPALLKAAKDLQLDALGHVPASKLDVKTDAAPAKEVIEVVVHETRGQERGEEWGEEHEKRLLKVS